MMDISINTPHITLQQILKLAQIISSGGMTKSFLLEEMVFVNGEREIRRGRKLFPGDIVTINNVTIRVTTDRHEN